MIRTNWMEEEQKKVVEQGMRRRQYIIDLSDLIPLARKALEDWNSVPGRDTDEDESTLTYWISSWSRGIRFTLVLGPEDSLSKDVNIWLDEWFPPGEMREHWVGDWQHLKANPHGYDPEFSAQFEAGTEFRLTVSMHRSNKCQHVGTGEFVELKEWKCTENN